MLNMNEKINESLHALKDQAKLAIRELISIRSAIADWCSEALTAQLTNDDELKQILLDQANELITPQTFEDFDDTYHTMNGICQEFTNNISDFWMEFDSITISKLIGVPPLCPHCHHAIEETDEFCPTCGQHIGAKRKYEEPPTIAVKQCACGRTHHREDRFCPSCGKEAE